MINHQVDFVFVDADHSTEGVLRDLTAWAPKVRPGGLIVGHDINWRSVLRAVEAYFGPGRFIRHLPDNLWYVNVREEADK